MINTFISGYRKSRTEPQFVTGDAVVAQLLCARSPDGSAEDQVVGRLLDPEVITVLRELPDRYRIVVYLADLEGLGYRQISALTGMPLGSVKSRLHRARCRLRAELSVYASHDQRASPTSCAGCALACQVNGKAVTAKRKGVAVLFGWVSSGSPSGLRSFDPVGIADLEYRMWVAYYLRRWTHLVAASVRLLWLGFGTDLARIVPGAWLMLRAVQLWAPFPDNDPDGAQARMRELYALVRLRFGQPADPARAASLEIDWWRAHRRRQHAPEPAETGDELAESIIRLYCYLFSETAAVIRPAATHRVRAMDLSDQWVREGCRPDSPLLPLQRAALVRAYAALLAAVHHEEG